MSLLLPLYLFGLLGLLLPWLLHRFSHFDPKEQLFPTTRFLEPTKPPTTNKSKLKYWLLLALRAAFLLMLCFLFAQPWLRVSNDAANAKAIQMVVVDNSFSMRSEDRLQQAINEATKVLAEISEQDTVQLFSFSSKLTAVTEPLNDRNQLATAVSQIQASYEAADYGELMRYLNKVAGDFKLPVSATFITDAQRSNLPTKMNALFANKLVKFSVRPIDIGTPVNYSLQAEAQTSDSVTARINVQVSASGQLSNERANLSGGSSTDIGADVSNSESALSNVVTKTVNIEMNDRVLASDTLLLSPGESRTISFENIVLPTNKDALLTVSFSESDLLAEDDQIVIPVRGLSVLNVAMTYVGSEPSEQAQVFAATALETNDEVQVEQVSVNVALDATVRHAVVFVDNLEDVPQSVIRFVSDGGNVLLVPSESAAHSDTKGVTNASRIATIDQAHPLGLGDIDWYDAGFYSNSDMKLSADDRVLLGLDNGTPILIERAVAGGGRLLLLNDRLNGFNSDFPLQPSYVVLMQRIIEFFNSSNSLPATVEIGQSLTVTANTQVLSPSSEPLLDISQLGRANSVRLLEPGVYSVLGSNSTNLVTAILNKSESNLLAIASAELDAWELRHNRIVSSQADESIQPTNIQNNAVVDSTNRLNLLRWLLPIVIGVLFMEILLANKMLWVRRDGV